MFCFDYFIIILQKGERRGHCGSFISINKRMVHYNVVGVGRGFEKNGWVEFFTEDFLSWSDSKTQNDIAIAKTMPSTCFIKNNGMNQKNFSERKVSHAVIFLPTLLNLCGNAQ